MHRLGAVAHKSSTCLCTDSRAAVRWPAGRQQRTGVGAGPCLPGQRAACGYPGHAGPIARPWRVGRTSGAAGLMSSAGRSHAEGQAVPSPVQHDQGVSPPETTIRCRWLPNSMPFIGCCGHYCVGRSRISISVRCGPTANHRLLKLNLARLVRQTGKRCHRRRPCRR
jgi:hypothetical protein